MGLMKFPPISRETVTTWCDESDCYIRAFGVPSRKQTMTCYMHSKQFCTACCLH